MTQEHPITPPPELIVEWAGSMCGYYEAARWGANHELDACCEWLLRSLLGYDKHYAIRRALESLPE